MTALDPQLGDTDLPALLRRLATLLAATPPPRPLAEARFLDTHKLFESRSDQRQQIHTWFERDLVREVRENEPCRVLSVGCGSGVLDVPVAKRFADRASSLHYVGVNPNQTECRCFAGAFDAAGIPNAELELAAMGFEDYRPGDQRFDVVHFVQALYYLPDIPHELERAYAMLAPGGILALVHAPRGALNELAAPFYDRMYGRRTLFAEDLMEMFDDRGWGYRRHRLDARLDVSALKDRGDEALALRDFIVQAETSELPTAVQQLLDTYLERAMVVRGDRAYIPHPVDVFVIPAR